MTPGPKPTPLPGTGETTLPKPPPQLKGRAKAEWKRIVPLLAERGIIARIDMASLAIYCQEFGRWQDAEEIVAKKGMHVKMKSGHIQDHPALMTARQAGKIVTRLAAEFGLTPSSRARIPAKAEEEPEELEI